MDIYTLKRHFSFSINEIKSIIVTVFFLGFMFSFREWGTEVFDFRSGLFNWINSMLVVLLALLVYISFQRIMGVRRGYKTEYKMWFWGLLVALLVTFISSGHFVLAFLGTVIIYHMEGHRLGSFRYGLNYRDLGIISLTGPLALIILALVFKLISFASASPLVNKVIIVCTLMASVNMLPLPWIDGGNVFFASRTLWVFAFVGIVAASVLLYFLNSLLGIIFGAIVIAIIAAVFWFVFFEEGF
jgi:hypothetical protein